MTPPYRRIAAIQSPEEFQDYVAQLGIELAIDDKLDTGPEATLGQPYALADGFVIGNRFCVQPMEGWDGTQNGAPSELTVRRWRRFGQSGAKLVWGGEAVAVRHDGRANAHQLLINEQTVDSLARLRRTLVHAHEEAHRQSGDLLVGLQLTHSGRFSRPNGPDLEPRILYHHPLLDARFGISPDHPVLTDGQIMEIIGSFIKASVLADRAGFDFVDIKHCHGYLGHEFLSARRRPGAYGGSFENRTRFLRETVRGIRRKVPDMRIGVRLSAFDFPPFTTSQQGAGRPVPTRVPYHSAFGLDPESPLHIDLEEPMRFVALLSEIGVELVNVTGGSPYYNPHIQRPALFPPSDGYQPPEDPLVGVARQIGVCAELKSHFPNIAFVGSAYSYLQEWIPHVAQRVVREGKADFVGLGRSMLPYPDLPADVLAGRPLDRRRICRTLSDCTTAPRHGLVSGCYPLDEGYRALDDYAKLQQAKKELGEAV